MAFHGQQYTLPVYGYHAWWRGADLTETFAYHRRVVKLLQSRRPPDLWLFKAPHHKFHLEAIVSAYPDVRFVMTHRDPAKVGAVVREHRVGVSSRRRSGERDLHRLGGRCPSTCASAWSTRIAARARIGEDRFLDVHHRDLIADPDGHGRRVYDFLGLELRPAVEQAVLDWQRANRSGAHGTHRYTAEQFGLSAGAAARRLRLLHPPLRRRRRRLSRSDEENDDERIRTRRALPSWADQMQALERRRRQPARDVAPRRRDRRRAPGHEQARAVDPRLRLPVPRLHRREPSGVHAAVELRVQPGRARPRLRLLDDRGRPDAASTGSPASAARRASSRSPSRAST